MNRNRNIGPAALVGNTVWRWLAIMTMTACAFLIMEREAMGKAVVDAVAIPKARVEMLERVKTAVARAGQMELANLKRLYKAEGFSESEIHSVIPDRPRPKREPAAPAVPPATPKPA